MPQSSIGFGWSVFGAVIKSLREADGLTLRDKADQIPGVSYSRLSVAERGNEIPVPLYLTLCKHYDLDPFDGLNFAGKTIEQVRAEVASNTSDREACHV